MDKAEELKQEAEKYFQHKSHGFDHVMRVYKLSMKIAEKENVDLDCMRAAALLHDIARSKEFGKDFCHAQEGAKMAIPILQKLGYSEEQIETIADAIKTHRYKNQLAPNSKVGEILQDADRLDALGAIGCARIMMKSAESDVPLHDSSIPPKEKYDGKGTTTINHFYEKIFKIDPDSFKTETAKQIARERYDFTQQFVRRFEKEWDGND